MTPFDWNWVRENIQCVICEDTRGVVAERSGKIVSAFVADSWTENSVQCHQAVLDPMALKAGIHREFARYVFGEAGRKVMIGLTPSDRPKAIRLNEHYGFTEAYRLKDGVRDGVDYIVMTMTAEQCRYYDGETNGVDATQHGHDSAAAA
jgi:hypothetical protein